METNSSSRSNKTQPYTPDPSAPPIAEAVVVDSNGIEKEAAALRERVAMQEQKIAEQSTIIQQQQAHYSNTFRGRYKQEEDMTLRMKFLRQHACKLFLLLRLLLICRFLLRSVFRFLVPFGFSCSCLAFLLCHRLGGRRCCGRACFRGAASRGLDLALHFIQEGFVERLGDDLLLGSD